MAKVTTMDVSFVAIATNRSRVANIANEMVITFASHVTRFMRLNVSDVQNPFGRNIQCAMGCHFIAHAFVVQFVSRPFQEHMVVDVLIPSQYVRNVKKGRHRNVQGAKVLP